LVGAEGAAEVQTAVETGFHLLVVFVEVGSQGGEFFQGDLQSVQLKRIQQSYESLVVLRTLRTQLLHTLQLHNYLREHHFN
jgi:hypothetical protein